MEVIVDSTPLALVDDAGYWFSVWGGYSESNRLSCKLLRYFYYLRSLDQQVSAN